MSCQEPCSTIVLQLLVFGLANGAVVALSAAGFTLAYGVAGQMNLAHGNVFALTTVVVASLTRAAGVTAATSLAWRVGLLVALLVVGTLVGALLNLLVERLAFRPFQRRSDRLAPLIASVALSFLFLGVAVRWHAATTVPMPGHQGVNLPMLAMPDLLPSLELGGAWGISFTTRDAFVLLVGALVAAGLTGLLAHSRAGRLLRAVAQDAEAAALCGADPRRAQELAFAVAGALAGAGAAIFAAYYEGTTAQHGLRGGFAAMTAAVLGGVGNPLGALAGGVAVGVFSSFSDYLLDAFWTPVLVLGLLITLLVLRPGGLLGAELASGAAQAEPAADGEVPVSWPPRAQRLVLIGLLALGLSYPLLDQLAGWGRLYSAVTALLLVTLALGLRVVVGLAGLLDLGYAAFFAIGAYSAAILTGSGSRLGLALPAPLREPWLALPLAGLAAGAIGLLCGVPSVRTRGEYLALVTLAFGEIVPSLILHAPDWTGGARGMSGLPELTAGPWPDGSALHSYVAALGLALLTALATARLATARAGRAWTAVRDDEAAAAACGINPARARLLAFGIGALFAGLAGALYAGLQGHVEPDQFDFTLSLMVLAAVTIGQRHSTLGVVLGALIVATYGWLLVELASSGLRALSGATGLGALASIDLRGDNFAVFGLALYAAVVVRGRRLER